MDKAVVVLGEASETDSEDEVHGKVLKTYKSNFVFYYKNVFQSKNSDGFSKAVQGILVTGEDTESDNGKHNKILTKNQ